MHKVLKTATYIYAKTEVPYPKHRFPFSVPSHSQSPIVEAAENVNTLQYCSEN